MKLINRLFAIMVVLAVLFSAGSIYAAVESTETVKNLSKAYESWKNQGIKFVVRDSKGKFVHWAFGRLESWGAKSKWVVRDPKGHFLTHANGTVENWKNGQTRLVLRDNKGRLLTHVNINLTESTSFAATVVGLRHLKNDKFLAFVQDSLSDIIIGELKQDHTAKASVLIKYLNKYKNDKGTENFKPVLRKIIPVLVFMSNDKPNDIKTKTMVEDARKLLTEL
ncbi:MAG: hypothetical protein GQF41_3452 [Candidatus Rifleibacterium amylolyticum]|nr:MAG: hypothetical protein GQF41_3452 [Candidatus Rifleibacterium amylolyticum]NLF95281.1 hypothetical protein [Candidatus Riflebacteria bacterium]